MLVDPRMNLMNGLSLFARRIASSWHRFGITRSSQFARWLLRHRGRAQAAGLGPYQLVYRHAVARSGSFQFRITIPLYRSQATHATVNLGAAQRAQFTFAVLRDEIGRAHV